MHVRISGFIDIYVLYTYLFRCDLQPCLPGLQVPMNHISYPSQHTEGRLAKSSKEGNRHLHPNYNLADLCAYEQDHFLTSVNVIYPLSDIAKLITKNDTYISITLIILEYSCFPKAWFNQEKIYFCHHLRVFKKLFNNIVT